ncbi:MAG TPA: response regulator [Chthoniobacteraceae bacterium]|jgi:CheY-like chemotaxis protein
MRVLSVDDKDENLYMLEALLRGHGHQVDSASNGVEALKLAERGVYDLIISDILMPGMDGFQLCRELKKDRRLGAIPFIFYTATYTDPRDAAFALSLGADRFLIKPVEPEILIRHAVEVAESGGSLPKAQETTPAPDETIYLKEYNTRLIAKLEQKSLDLEQTNRALQADILERQRTEAERQHLEQQLRQSQKLEAIGTLAGGIAHDFNNILAGIIGFAELGIAERNIDEAHAHLQEVLCAGHRAKALVEQILAFSRPREQKRTALQLQHAIPESLKMLRATIPAHIEIRSDLEASAPTILGDATQVHQVLLNLVTNAWHAIGDQPGVVDLKLRTRDLDDDFVHSLPELRPGRYVCLSVKDSGCGINSEMAERIFEPFFTTKEPGKGTGLGLSVVHGIMKASDGAITMQSQPGLGTTFHLYFPAVELEPSQPMQSPAKPPQGTGQRILFVDDEVVLTTLGERFLRRLGYVPVTTTGPGTALELFKAQEFDLVITDMTMPQTSGIDLGRQLLELRPGIPVILTTGYSASLDGERVQDLGFKALLLKPYNLQSLGECVQRVLAEAEADSSH